MLRSVTGEREAGCRWRVVMYSPEDVHAQYKGYRPFRPFLSSPLPFCLRAPLPPFRHAVSFWCRLRARRTESSRGVFALLIGARVDGRFLLFFPVSAH